MQCLILIDSREVDAEVFERLLRYAKFVALPEPEGWSMNKPCRTAIEDDKETMRIIRSKI